MGASRRSFEHAVAIAAIAADSTVDYARAEVILDGLRWLHTHLPADSPARPELIELVRYAAAELQGVAAELLASQNNTADFDSPAEKATYDALTTAAGTLYYNYPVDSSGNSASP